MKSSVKILFIVCFVFVGISGCNYLQNVRLLTAGNVDAENYVETLPFEFKKDIIIIEANIQGDTIPGEFIFDTGAFESKIATEKANQLNLPVKATKENSTAQGITQQIEIIQTDSIKLGSIAFRKISAGKLTYDSESASRCLAKEGIIGANLIKLAHWFIDYDKKEISFSDHPFSIDKSKVYYQLPFKTPLLSGTPSIELSLNGRKVQGILFDVGFNGGLVLPKEWSSYFKSSERLTFVDRSTSGIFGANTDTLITKTLTVSVGGFSTDIPVEFSSLGKALLGNEFLKHFSVSIDYESKNITLYPQKEVIIQNQAPFIPGILNDSLWTVNRIPDSHSLSLGDTLVHINGYKPVDLFPDFCSYVNSIGSFLRKKPLVVQSITGETYIF
jgi:predicted aspartyl protease